MGVILEKTLTMTSFVQNISIDLLNLKTMKTIKVLTLFCLLSLGFFCKSANAQMYIVTESKEVVSGLSVDSVFVTDPSGVTVKHQIPLWDIDNSGHDSQLSIILNGIINLGYKNMYPIVFSTQSSNRVFYFAKQ